MKTVVASPPDSSPVIAGSPHVGGAESCQRFAPNARGAHQASGRRLQQRPGVIGRGSLVLGGLVSTLLTRIKTAPPAAGGLPWMRRPGVLGLTVVTGLLIAGCSGSPPTADVGPESQDTGEVAQPGNPPDVHDEAGNPYPAVPRITVEEAKIRYDSAEAVFVDVRTLGEYETARVAQSVSLPLADLATGNVELDVDAEIITYCT